MIFRGVCDFLWVFMVRFYMSEKRVGVYIYQHGIPLFLNRPGVTFRDFRYFHRILVVFMHFGWILGFPIDFGDFPHFLQFWWIRGTVVQHRPRQVDFLLCLQRVFKLSEHGLRSRECQIPRILVDFCDFG